MESQDRSFGQLDGAPALDGSPEQATSRSDDRIWAALAHASAVLMFFGPLIPVIIWFTQRKKSAFIAFQALQAMAYQIVFLWSWFTLIPLLMIVVMMFFVFGTAVTKPGPDNSFPMVVLPQLAIWGFLVGAYLLYGVIGVIGAVVSLMGREFRYPLIGNWLSRYLGYAPSGGSPLSEDKEDRVVAAASHSTCLLLFGGLFTPLTVWITQHQRSRFLGFQSMQAALYQGIGLLGYFAFLALYMLFIFGMFALLTAGDFASRSSAPAGGIFLFLLPFSCVILLLALLVPLYHFLGFLGSVRVLRGHDFHYPLLGRLVASRMNTAEGK